MSGSFGLLARASLLVAGLLALVVPGLVVAQESTPAAAPMPSGDVQLDGLLDRPGELAIADLMVFPAESVEVTYRSGKGDESHTFTGTRLWNVLDDRGLDLPDTKNGQLHLVVRVEAIDGYLAVISLGEIDPKFGDAPILLAWEQDGTPLDAPRLVVPGDVHGGRYVSDVISITLQDASGT